MTREKRGTDGASTSKADGAGRNRATPASLFKLYHAMTEDQKNLVTDVGFGGLLKIGSGRLPSAISKWLLSKFDAEKEQLVIPGRGKIKANAAAVRRILDLPMGEDEVKYEFNGSAINFINGSCNFENCKAPRVCSLREKLQGNKEATHEYLRGWLMLAISTFLCGSTSLTISPKCYPALVDLDKVKDLNWYQFVVDTLKTSVRKMDTQNTVLGCQYFLTILYLDTLELPNSIQVPEKQPRVAAWNMKLINKVIKLDTYPNRTFGKLRLKKLDGSVTETSILGDLNDIENLISERAPRATSAKKKRRVSQVIRKACIGITEVIGTMISEFFAISDDSDVQEEPRVRRSKRTRPSSNHRQAAFVVDDDDDDDNDVDYVADEDEEKEVDEEDESKYEEEDLEHEGVELEDEGVELEDEGVDLHDEDVYADGLPPVILAHSPEPWGKKVSEKKGDTPASTTAAEGKGRMHCAQEPMDRGKEPMPLEVVLPHKFAKEKLRLPCSTVAAGKSEKPAPRAPWDFSPPSFDLGIESPEPQPNKCSPQRETDHYYDKFWDYLSEEQLMLLDEEEKNTRQRSHRPQAM